MNEMLDKRVTVNGFTLAELLVTIAIIALLAAIVFPLVNKAIVKGEKARAQAEIAGIAAAIKSYYNEYGKMPCVSNGNPDRTFNFMGHTDMQREVMDILRAMAVAPHNVNHENNPRRIVFLDVPHDAMIGKDRSNDDYDPDAGYYLDPWGNPYVICMDTDFDFEVKISDMSKPASLPTQNYLDSLSRDGDASYQGVTIAVMSYGSDPMDTNEFLMSWRSN